MDRRQETSNSIVAILTIPREPSPATAQATITFRQVEPNKLSFNGPERVDTGYLDPGTFLTAYATYRWLKNDKQNVLEWTRATPPFSATSSTGSATVSPRPESSISQPSTGALTSNIGSTVLAMSTSDSTPASRDSQGASNTSLAATVSATTDPGTNGSGQGRITSGAATGIAIGCLVAGALISGLVFWFCLGKRRASRARDSEASSTALLPQEKGFAAKATSLGSGSPTSPPLSGALPLPLEDKAITGEISKISNSIKNHIQSYYHTGRVSPGLLDLDDIQAIGNNLPISIETLSTLLGSSATREIALRLCIGWVVCARILPGAESRSSLLPTDVATCFQKIENANHDSNAYYTLVPRWRVMTAELMQSSCVRDPFTPSDSRNNSIHAALTTLENILQPYADSRIDNQQRRRNLEEIIKRSALFAFTLFSQPSIFDFDWRVEHIVKSSELCIFPALVQLSDETGHPVNPPRPFSEAVVRRLDV